MVIMIVVVFIFLGLGDFPKLISTKKSKEIIVLSLLYVGVFVLAIMQATRGSIPSPMKAIHYVIDNYLKLSFPPPPE